jgi:ABC-type transport system involved in cytochrome bd biosynthesis fused ATPase/permease subunit
VLQLSLSASASSILCCGVLLSFLFLALLYIIVGIIVIFVVPVFFLCYLSLSSSLLFCESALLVVTLVLWLTAGFVAGGVKKQRLNYKPTRLHTHFFCLFLLATADHSAATSRSIISWCTYA